MSESIIIPNGIFDKKGRYEALLSQIQALIDPTAGLIANLANIIAVLKFSMNYFYWVGCYFVKNNELILGPFQGPVACTRIAFGKGVCGTSWKEKRSIIVPDVDQFPGHIACSASSKSEIVIPLLVSGEVFLVLDIDSDVLNNFDQMDEHYLEKILTFVAIIIKN